jgi:hypothetical protein
MTAKSDPKVKIYPTQKQGMQADKSGTDPSGGTPPQHQVKEIPAYTQDRNQGKSGIVVN